MEAVMEHPEMAEMKRFVLATADAHRLYQGFGFEPLEKPERWMIRIGSVLETFGRTESVAWTRNSADARVDRWIRQCAPISKGSRRPNVDATPRRWST